MATFSGNSRVFQLSQRHPICTFGVMVLSFIVFGLFSLKLVEETLANFNLIRQYGWLALSEGAFWQLLSLISQAVLAVFSYLVFKACESALVHRIFQSRA